MDSHWRARRVHVVEAGKRLAEMGLTTGTSGNLSVRLRSDDDLDLIAITPAGRRCEELDVDDVAIVDFDLEPVEGDRVPSSESLLHVAIYRARPDVGAVVHTHSTYATVAAVTGLSIPPVVDEMVVAIGGAIEVSEYAFPGSQELADRVCGAMGERNAALIGGHGAVGVGRDLAEALDTCALVERVAQVFVLSSLLGSVNTLPKEVVEAERSIFRMRRQG